MLWYINFSKFGPVTISVIPSPFGYAPSAKLRKGRGRLLLSHVMPDFIRHPEKLDTGSEAGMTKASGTEAVPRDNINRSRAAQAAE